MRKLCYTVPCEITSGYINISAVKYWYDLLFGLVQIFSTGRPCWDYSLRAAILLNEELRSKMPPFILECHTLDDCSKFIKTKAIPMQNGAFFLAKSLSMQTLLYTIFPLLLVMRPFQKPYHTENFWWIHGKRHYDVEQQILMAQLLRHEPTGDYFQVCLRWKGTANKLRQKYKFAESLQCSIRCYSYSPSVYDRRSVKKIIWIIYISSWSDWRVKECTKRWTWQIRKWYQTGKTNCFVSHQSNRIYLPNSSY